MMPHYLGKCKNRFSTVFDSNSRPFKNFERFPQHSSPTNSAKVADITASVQCVQTEA